MPIGLPLPAVLDAALLVSTDMDMACSTLLQQASSPARVERCARGLDGRATRRAVAAGHPEQRCTLSPMNLPPEPTLMFEEKKHLQLIHERSTALNGTNNHQSPSSKPRVRAMLEPMTFLNQYTVPNSVTAESSWHCLRCHHGEIAAMIKTRSNPLSKPRAHAMTCMNQKRAAEFTGIAFAAETADTAESAAMSVPRAASTHSHYSTLLQQASTPAELPLVHRPLLVCPAPGTRVPASVKPCSWRGSGDESERHGAESQWIVAARPLCHLQYPVAYLSRLQRILPAARWELYFKAARAALPPRGLGQRHVPPGPRGPYCSPDSDLEAFSHNPTHGSFAPLAFQPSAMTNSHVPYWWVNNPTLGEFCFTMIGRADIEGSKSNVAMNAWLPQASYPCGNFSDTSSFKFRRSKGSIGHAFTVRIRTGNQNQTSFYPFVPHEISVLVELILGHLRYLLTDVPPQPNSPPDNVFRPDRPPKRPWVQKEGQRPASDSRNNRIPLVRTSSESTVRRPGKAPERAVPSPSPGRHATTRSRRGSSSSSPPTADGFGTGTPEPSPQSQSFSRGYGSILPTSLAYIVPSTRGCSPWRPDAVMSTTGRGRHSVLRIFKGRRGRTGHHATCGALPAAGPYLRLSRFQEKITLPEAPADVSGLPNVAVSRHVPDRLTHVQVPFTWNLSPLRPSKFSFEYLLLPPRSARRPLRPGSRPGFCSDRRALLLIGAWRLPRRPGIGRALQRHPFSGLVDSAADFDFHDHRPAVSAQLGTVTRLPVHPASPVLLTKNGPLGALDSVARLNEAAAPSYLFKSFAPIPKSDERFARQYRCGPPPEFPLASPRSGIVHHLSGPDRHALTRTLLRRSRSVGGATLEGIPLVSFLAPYGFTCPLTRTHVRLLGPCFKTGRMGSPQADARSAHSTIAATASPQAFQRPGLRPPPRSASVHAPSRSADRLSPFHIRPGASPAPIHFPPDNFKHSLTLFSKSFSSFPRGTCLLSVSRPYLALDGIYRPIGAAFPNNPTRRQRLVVRQGPVTTGLSPSPAPPSRGLGPGPPLRTLLQTTIRTPRAPDSQAGHFPVRSPLLGESLASLKANARGSGRSRGRQARARPCPRVSQPPLVVATAAEDSILGQPRAGARGRPVSAPALVSRGEWGRRCVTPRQTCPRPGGLGRNLRSKTRWFTGFCNSHQVSHFATFFIDARAEISVAESRSDYHKKKARPRHRGYEGGLLVLNFLGASRAGVRWRAVSGADASLHGTRGHEGRVPPEPSLSCHGFAGRSAGAGFDNDPSAGSPTETLLRLLLPLNDKVQWTSRDVASGEPPTSPRSEHFTGPFNRPVIASNFLGLEGHSPSKKLAAEGHLRIAS
uniref:Senescence-associated protein n=3 Tax=Salix viminalis TaxID=40686 RepID=A0A6N2N5W2_SALVM